MYTTIQTLWERGFNKTEIAKMTGNDWKTVAKVVKLYEQGQLTPVKKAHPSQLDGYKEQILEWLEHELSAVRIHEKLKESGYTGSYSSVKIYVKNLKTDRNICIRFHSEPGEEAQVDFGYVGKRFDKQGKLCKAWVFNMRLSYSRLDYYEVVFDQTVETFIQCHIHAFEYFGGIPACVKIDNLKAAVLEANFYEPVFQSLYKQFADNYQFMIVPCRVRQPQEKGKVESGIKYIKNNFFKGRDFTSWVDLQQQLQTWLDITCNQRIHGTTRQQPKELFESCEKAQLKALPEQRYRIPKVGTRLVYRDCHIYIDKSYYSVPYEYVGQEVEIEVDEKIVRIHYQGKLIAIHCKASKAGQFVTQDSHYPPYKIINSSDYKQAYQHKMAQIGEYAENVYLQLLQTQPYHWQRTLQGILSLKKTYPCDVINLACQRALVYGALQYRQIKAICQSGCYRLPIESQQGVYH